MSKELKVPEVTDELRQFWKEHSEQILREYEAGEYDENNKAMMASVSWAKLSMEERKRDTKNTISCLTAGRQKLTRCVGMTKTMKISI